MLQMMFGIAVALLLLSLPVLGTVAFFLVLSNRRRTAELSRRLDAISRRLEELSRGTAAGPPPEREPERPAAQPQVTQPAEKVAPVVVAAQPAAVAEMPAPPAPPTPPVTAPPAATPREKRGLDGFEKSIGKRWIAWAGVLVLFLAAGFFVKYAIDNGWLGPTGRVVLGVISGIVLLVVGDTCVRRRMRALGQALMGGGLAILYVSLFAAFSLYDLVPQKPAFAAMLVVTAGGMTLAILHDAISIAFLAVLGGLLTPVMCSTGVDARDALFTYLALLNLGVVGVALAKDWRWLDLLTFVGTWALFAGWHAKFYTEAALVPAMLWLAGFFLIFLALPFVYNLRTGTPVPVARFLGELANAAVAFAYGYTMLHDDYRHMLGFLALGMAGCYVAAGGLIRLRIRNDARSLLGFVALAMVFLTIAIPLQFGLHGILIAWAAEAVVLLYLGYAFRYLPIRIGALVVFAVSVVRLFSVHWPLHEALFVLFWNTHFGAALCVPLAGALCVLVHRLYRKDATRLDPALRVIVAITSWLITVCILQGELGQWLVFSGQVTGIYAEHLARCSQAALWALGAAGLIAAGTEFKSLTARLVGTLVVAVAAVFAVVLYTYRTYDEYTLFLNVRFATALLSALVVFWNGRAIRRFREACHRWEQVMAKCLYWIGAVFLLAVLSLETYTWCEATVQEWEKARWTALMSLSIVWGVYAIALLVIGFWRKVRPLRFAALGLFALTALKLVFVDLAEIEQIYRVICFLVIGLLMVGASYLYHKVEQHLARTGGESQ